MFSCYAYIFKKSRAIGNTWEEEEEHSHMRGAMQGSYVKVNSIHHSYQRCVTTHDTNDWKVRDNVAY